eukprot:scaffold1065_cov114-Skeletonema_dohrnii-CCMP3373.AAC.9
MAINSNGSSSPAKTTATQYAKQGLALLSAGAKKCSPIISTAHDLSMPTTGETTPPSSRSTSTTKIKAPAKLSDCPSRVSPAEFFAAAVDDASSNANDRDASSSSAINRKRNREAIINGDVLVDNDSDEKGSDGGSDEDGEDSNDGADKGYETAEEAITATTNNRTIQCYELSERLHNKARLSYAKKDASDSILNGYFWNQPMINLPIILRNILIRVGDLNEIGIYVVLAVLMYEYVEYEMKSTSPEEHMRIIKWFRDKWAMVGDHINLGQFPNGRILMHSCTAFGTADDVDNPYATDKVDKINLNNHTMRHMGQSIVYDHLTALLGEDALTKDEAEGIVNEHTTRSDLFTEIGLVGNGNEASDYHKQLKLRHDPFCKNYKHLLKIVGQAFFEMREVKHYTGYHISALIGGLDLVMRAELTLKTTKRTLTVNMQSTRSGECLLNYAGNDDFDVRFNGNITVCRSIHPNRYERWLTTLSLDVIKKIAYSHSVAWMPLHGAVVTMSNQRVRLDLPPGQALSDGVVQRWWLRKSKVEASLDEKTIARIEEIEEIEEEKRKTKSETKEIQAKTKELRKKMKINKRLQKKKKNRQGS